MLQQIKTLSLQTLIYGSGHILARLVSFLLLPLYTNVFTARDYGVISLAYAFMGFMNVVLHYGLDAALMKRYVQAEVEGRTRYLATAYLSFVITTTAFALILLVFRQPVAPLLLGGDYPRFIIYVAGILFFDVLWSVPLLLLRSEEKPLAYIGFSLLNVTCSLGLNFLLVLKYKMGTGKQPDHLRAYLRFDHADYMETPAASADLPGILASTDEIRPALSALRDFCHDDGTGESVHTEGHDQRLHK